MSDSRQAGPDWSSNVIACTINNQTTGTIQYQSKSPTGGSITLDPNDDIDSGQSVLAFSAQGPTGWPSGCGGQVLYDLPNGKDQLVVVYNISDTANEAITFAQLQNQDGSAAACDTYFATVDPGSVNGTSLSPTVTVYELGATATGKTGSVNGTFVQITLVNQLSTWITLNSFPNPSYSGAPVVTDGTTSVAPNSSAVVLCSFEDGEFTLIYNITNDYLLTIQQNQNALPSAGFNADCPYDAVVATETVSGVEWAFTVTVSAT